MPETPPNLLPSEVPTPRESDAQRETIRLDAQSQPTVSPDAVASQGRAAPADPEGRPFGRYVLLQELGRGGMGVVWKAWDRQLQRIVALKQVLSTGEGTLGRAADSMERFTREARLAARLRHPGIVPVYDVGDHEGTSYYTSEFIEGRTLDRAMKDPRPLRQAVAWTTEVAEALGAAHEQGVLHRDVKPSNILIDREGHAHVMDFGLARELDLASESALTQSGDVLGTPGYMSPEQARGAHHETGPASDQFSLGVVLYELLTGRRPFEGTVLREVLNAIVEKDPAPPSRLNALVPPDVETICLKALEKDPPRRYASMAEMASDLRRYLAGDSIGARRHSFIDRVARKAKQFSAVAIPTAVALVLAIGFGAWFTIDRSLRGGRVAKCLASASASESRALAARDMEARRFAYAAARDALTSALSDDPASSEARSSLARVEAALGAIDRELSRDREDLSAKAATAQETLRKAGLVTQVLARWALVQDDLEKLERWSTDSRVVLGRGGEWPREAWPPLQKFIDETPQDPTSQAAMKPLAGWAKSLSGDRKEGWKWMEEGAQLDPDLPMSALMRALRLFSLCVDLQPLPPIRSGAGGIEFGPAPGEPPDLKEFRVKVVPLVDEAERAPVWGHEGAEEYRSAIEGVRALQRGDYAPAETAFTRAISAPELRVARSSFLIARAKMRYLQRHVQEALADLDAALLRRPDDAGLWLTKGLFLDAVAEEKVSRLEDARDASRQAVLAYDEAVSRAVGEPEPYVNRGFAWRRLGLAQEERGDDPKESYAKAIHDYEKAIALEPASAAPRVGRSYVWRRLGEHLGAHGKDPRDAYQQAIDDADKAIGLDRDDLDGYEARGLARLHLGEVQASMGADPKDLYRKAIDDFGYGAEHRPVPEFFCYRGNAEGHLGDCLMREDSDPADLFRRAIADYDQALKRFPEYADAMINRALVLERTGEWQTAHGVDARETQREAIDAYDKVLAKHPTDIPSLLGRGLALMGLGTAQAGAQNDPTKAYEEAIQAFDKVLSRRADLIEGLMSRAMARRFLGTWKQGRGEDAKSLFLASLKDIDRAIQIAPSQVDGYLQKGATLEEMGELDKAIETYERALRALGGHVPSIEEALDHARRAAAAKAAGPGH